MRRLKLGFILLGIGLLICCKPQKRELTFWVGGAPDEISFWMDQIDNFEKKFNIRVRVVRQPTYTDQRLQKLAISLTSKQPNPDVFLMDVVWIEQFIQSGWLAELDLFMKESQFPLEHFYLNIIQQTDQVQGKTYALPIFMDIPLLYYRKDLLTRQGYESPPRTWDELRDMANIIQDKERMTNPHFHGFVWQGAQYEGLVCSFLEFITSFKGAIFIQNALCFNHPSNQQALKLMVQLIHSYKLSPLHTYTEMKEEEVRRSFQAGNALFERNWLYCWNLHQKEGSPVKGRVGVTPLPGGVGTLGGWHGGISRFSDMKSEAWRLLSFILSKNFQKKMLHEIGWFPSRKDILKSMESFPHIQVAQQVFHSAVTRPRLPFYQLVSEVIQRKVNAALSGTMDEVSALNQGQKEIQKILHIYEQN